MIEKKRGRGRPTSGGPVVAAKIDGKAIAWCDGAFAGDAGLVADAKMFARLGVQVPLAWGGQPVAASSDTPLGAAAAITAVNPGRTVIVAAPEEISELLGTHHSCISFDDEDGFDGEQAEEDDVQE